MKLVVQKLLFPAGLILLLAVAQACSLFASISDKDTPYLTPLAWETVSAAQITYPIDNKLEAVIAAQRALGSSRLRSNETPRVVYVERLRYADARRDFIPPEASAAESYLPDTQVWLVVFAGDWRVEGGPAAPNETDAPRLISTPSPTSERCVFILFPASENIPGRSVGGIYDCELWR